MPGNHALSWPQSLCLTKQMSRPPSKGTRSNLPLRRWIPWSNPHPLPASPPPPLLLSTGFTLIGALTMNLCGSTADKNGTCAALPATRMYLSRCWFVLVTCWKHQIIARTIFIRSMIRVIFKRVRSVFSNILLFVTATWVTRTRIAFSNFRFLCRWRSFNGILSVSKAV